MNKSDLKIYKNTVRKGDVILTFNLESLLARAIGKITDSQWSHTALAIGYGNMVESTIGGVMISKMEKYFDEKHNIFVLRLKEGNEQLIDNVVKSSLKYVGKRYGYLQILWYLFIRLIGKSEDPKWQLDLQKRAMVCSEAIARSLKDAGLEIKPGYKPSGVEPVDFLQSDLFDKIMLVNKGEIIFNKEVQYA